MPFSRTQNLGIKMTHLQRAYIFDIDGVLADCSHRLHFIQQEPKDWKRFYENSDKDAPIKANVELLHRLYKDYQVEIMFVTGRTEAYRAITSDWLRKEVLETQPLTTCSTMMGCDLAMELQEEEIKKTLEQRLFMRKNGDFRPDWEIKKEIYENEIKCQYEILGVFEDRTQVVQMWRSLGLTCYQVCEGNY